MEDDGQGSGGYVKEEEDAIMTKMRCASQLVEKEHCCAGLFAVVAMAPLLSLCWSFCHCCNGALSIVVLASWSSLHWHCCHWCTGIVAIVVLALSHCHTGIITHFVALALNKQQLSKR
jgi:hypothetical protein